MKTLRLMLPILMITTLCVPSYSVAAPVMVVVENADITLADLKATVTASKTVQAAALTTPLVPAPAAGQSLMLTRQHIRTRLRGQGFDPDALKLVCPESICVTRRAARIKGADIVAAGERVVRESCTTDVPGDLIITALTHPSDMTITAGKVSLVASLVPSTTRCRATATVTASVDGRQVYRGILSYRISLMGEVLVAGRNLPRGATLTAADVTTEKRDLLTLQTNPVVSAADLADRRTTRQIAARTPITDAMIESIPLVRKGQDVVITVRATGVVVTAPGVALEDGRRGDMVRVRIASSRDDFFARVAGTAAVVVSLEAQERAEE